MKIAHYSDIHMTVPPWRGGVAGLVGKRSVGALNYYVGGRRRHFARVEHRILRLLEDVDAQAVDHAICTGDVTQMSRPEEFERCAQIFGTRLHDPSRLTVLPGNHDRYTPTAQHERRFERHFGDVAPDAYPFAKRVGDVVIVALDVARAAGLLDSSGYAGPEQLERLRALLTAQSPDTFVILAMHYGLFRKHGEPDRKRHGIRDYEAIVDVIADPKTHVHAIIHGHMHDDYRIDVHGVPEICSGSATDVFRPCGYNVYTVDPATKSIDVDRRVWDAEQDRYVAGEFQRAVE